MVICATCHRPYDGDGLVCPFDGTPLTSEARAAGLAGKVLSHRYRLDSLIGRGGMGAVYRAVDLEWDRPVAVKVLPAAVDGRPDAIERFTREARAVSALDDPRIIRVYSHGLEPQGTRWIVMELLSGRELSARLSTGPITLGEVLLIAREVAGGLAAAHAAGVVHRDLKPSNVFLLEEASPESGASPRIKILDFGVAKVMSDDAEVTQVGVMVGTPAYMAPEQARGSAIDARADVYGLGALLFRLLSGRLPFSGESAAVVLAKVLTDSVPPLRRLRPSLPQCVEDLVLRAMSRAPEDRFPTVTAMGEAIDRCLEIATPQELAASDAEVVVRDDQETMDERPSSKEVVRLAEQRLLTLLWAEGADEATFAPLHDELLRAGAVAEQVIGDRGFGLFGAEMSEGDEPLRAVRAAMAGRRSSLRIGIATGRGRAGSGEALRGSVVEAASRIAASAAPGDVVCDDETYRRIRGRFDMELLSDGCWGIRGERPHGFVIGVSTSLGIETPLVGRDVELSQLRAAFHRAEEEASSQTVVLVGAPGIGKSRLAHDVRLYLESLPYRVHYLEGSADAAKRSAPFHLVATAIRRKGGLVLGEPAEASRAKLLALVSTALDAPTDAREVIETAHLLGAATGVDFPESRVLAVVRPDPRLFRDRLIDAFVAYLRGLGREPTVMVLEDLHHADEGTLSVVDRLMDAGDGARILLLLLTQPSLLEERPDFLAGGDAVRLELRPLSRRASGELLRALLPGTLPEETAQILLGRAGGVPFFIEALCAELRDRHALTLVDGVWHLQTDGSLALPSSVEAVLQARLDHLPAQEKDLLLRASVLGELFWDRALEALGATRVSILLPRLRARELVLPRSTSTYRGSREYGFRNSLVREVAYGMLADEARAGLHRIAAGWLAAQGGRDPALLGRHYDLAGESARAADLLLEAAREASARQAYAEALAHATRALALTQETMQGIEARLIRHEVFAVRDERGSEAAELDALEAMLAETGVDREGVEALRAEIRLRRGQHLRFAGDIFSARAAIEEASLGFGELGRESDVARALLALAEISNASGAYEETERHAKTVAHIAERTGRRDLAARAIGFLGAVKTATSDFQAGRDYLASGLAIAREIGDRFAEVRTLINLGWVLNQLGAWQSAAEHLEAARAPAQLLGKRLAIGYLEHNLGMSRLMMGRVQEAMAAEERAMRIGAETQDHRLVCVALRYLSLAQLRAGRPDAAEKSIRESIRRARALQHEELEAEALVVLVTIRHARGDTAGARAPLERALAIRSRLGRLDEHEVELLVLDATSLEALGQSAEARQSRAAARALVEDRARLVQDEALRASYRAIPAHAALLGA